MSDGALEWSGFVLFCRETEVGSVEAIWVESSCGDREAGEPGCQHCFLPLSLWVLAGVGRQAGLMVV